MLKESYPTKLKIKDYAFPNPREFTDPGLTKRELFAAMAMQASASSYETMVGVKALGKEEGISIVSLVAMSSVEYADALIAELNK